MGISTNDHATSVQAPTQTVSPVSPEVTRDLTSHNLPDAPLVTIEPKQTWSLLDLRDLWAFRELLYFLTWRDIKVRYKQTAIGVAWVILQPVLSTIIFAVFLGKLARVPSENVPYVLFAYAGLVFWIFFSTAITQGGNSVVGSSHLITKVYFPRLIIPTAAVAARLLDFGIAFLLLIALLVYYRVNPGLGILLLPIPLAVGALLALGISMWASAVNVKYRDVGVALPVLIQLWMFVSPVVYPASMVPEKWRAIYALNPVVGIIGNLRATLFGQPFDWYALAISSVFTLAFLIYSAFIFRRMERSFADIV